jgi:hypothetical protein
VNIPLMTEIQNKKLNEELLRITDDADNKNVRMLYTPYAMDVYVSYQRYAEDELDVGLETFYVRITPNGIIDHDPMTTIQFHSMADKISFFNSLREP